MNTDYIARSTGPRREPPAICYACGAEVPDTPRFGQEATCDECARNPPLFAERIVPRSLTPDQIDMAAAGIAPPAVTISLEEFHALYPKAEPLALFTFQRDGQTHICAWHPGFDRTHPANAGASHGICPDCEARL